VTRRPSAFRQHDLTKAVKGVIAAGLHVIGVKISPQGDIEIVTGESAVQDSALQNNEVETWLGKHYAHQR
jgi:hypothetical protein